MTRALLVALLVGAVYGPLLLTSGFDHDETLQLAFLEGAPPRADHELSKLELWSFADGSPEELQSLREEVRDGTQPWCTDTQHRLAKMKFLRPLSSASVVLDHALFGLNASGYHLQTLLWFTALLLVVGALLERTLPRAEPGRWWKPSLAVGALLLFAVDATHAEVMGRTATRHLLMAAAFGAGGLLAHVLWRQGRLRGGRTFSLALFLLGMSSSENVFQLLAYVLAFELVGNSDPWPARARALAPLALLSAGYVVLYKAMGYGAVGRGYIDVFSEPGAFLRAVPLRLGDLVVEEALSLPAWRGWGSSPWQLVGLGLPPAARLGLAATAVLGLAFWLRSSGRGSADAAALRWLGLGSLLAIVPALPGQPGPRLLLVPSIGASAILAALIGRRPRVLRWFFGALALALITVRGGASPPALFTQLATYERISSAIEQRWLLPGPSREHAPAGESSSDGSPASDVVVLTAPSTSVPRTFLPELRVVMDGERALPRPPEQRWWYLSNDTLDFGHEWLRTGPNGFELATAGAKLSRPLLETLWIGCQTVRGAVVPTRTMRITVLETVDPGGIRRIGVALDRNLDHPSVWFVAWRDGALRRVAVPQVGGRMRLD